MVILFASDGAGSTGHAGHERSPKVSNHRALAASARMITRGFLLRAPRPIAAIFLRVGNLLQRRCVPAFRLTGAMPRANEQRVSIIGDLRDLVQDALSNERQEFLASLHVPQGVVRAQQPAAIRRESERENRVSPPMQRCFLLLQVGIEDQHAAMVGGERGGAPVRRIGAASYVARRP